MTNKLAGRRILLTGASRGIGRAVAFALANDGASLALVARNRNALEAVREGLPGGPHDVFAFDVADEQAWTDAADQIVPSGELRGVVAAAAVLPPIGRLGTWPVRDFRRTLDVNIIGTLLAVVTFIDVLCGARGSVVTFSGGGATGPFPRFSPYAASKATVVRLTENLSLELAEFGVRLNSIAPGFIVSPLHDETLAAGPLRVGAEYFERTKRAVESGDGDSPRLAVDLVSFLLSDESTGISGKLISARWDPWQEQDFKPVSGPIAISRRFDESTISSSRSSRTIMTVAGARSNIAHQRESWGHGRAKAERLGR